MPKVGWLGAASVLVGLLVQWEALVKEWLELRLLAWPLLGRWSWKRVCRVEAAVSHQGGYQRVAIVLFVLAVS